MSRELCYRFVACLEYLFLSPDDDYPSFRKPKALLLEKVGQENEVAGQR